MKLAESAKLNNAGVSVARKRILVQGVVQGVGFRPFVYRLAHDCSLAGWVLNHSGGVDLEVEGPVAALEGFVADLCLKAPPLARIERVDVEDVPVEGDETALTGLKPPGRPGESGVGIAFRVLGRAEAGREPVEDVPHRALSCF